MARSSYQSVVLAKRPGRGNITPGETFHLKINSLPNPADLKDDQVLVESLYLSLDPAARVWINEQPSYLPPVELNSVMRGMSLCRVLFSNTSKCTPGMLITCASGWAELAIIPTRYIYDIIPALPSPNLSLSASQVVKPIDYLSILSFTGLTAYFGLLHVGALKAGDFVVVTGAAGATGSVACQIAKIKGARVLATAGNDEKCRWLREEVGCDEVLNYKDEGFRREFRERTKGVKGKPGGKIDVLFDNIGGEMMDLALSRASMGARFVVRGAISQFNALEAKGVKNLPMLIVMRIKLQGFIVFDYAPHYEVAKKHLVQWLQEGRLKRRETIAEGGIAAAEHALIDLYKGANTGKMLVKVKSLDDKSDWSLANAARAKL